MFDKQTEKRFYKQNQTLVNKSLQGNYQLERFLKLRPSLEGNQANAYSNRAGMRQFLDLPITTRTWSRTILTTSIISTRFTTIMTIQPTSIPQSQTIKQRGLPVEHRAIRGTKIKPTLRTATKNTWMSAYANIKGQAVSRVCQKLVRIRTRWSRDAKEAHPWKCCH